MIILKLNHHTIGIPNQTCLFTFLQKFGQEQPDEDPNGDIEMDFIATSNCQNAPFETWEEAQAAALEQAMDGTHEYWQFTEQFWKCPP